MNSASTYLTASASLDNSGASDVPGVNFDAITVVDTQSGNLPWTVSALVSDPSGGGSNPGGTISGENVGLSNLAPVYVSGNATQSGDVNVTNQPFCQLECGRLASCCGQVPPGMPELTCIDGDAMLCLRPPRPGPGDG